MEAKLPFRKSPIDKSPSHKGNGLTHRDERRDEMSLREEVHQLIEELPEESLDRARSMLETLQSSPRSFEKVIDRRLRELTEEELASLPTDVGDNLDQYVYGMPKS